MLDFFVRCIIKCSVIFLSNTFSLPVTDVVLDQKSRDKCFSYLLLCILDLRLQITRIRAHRCYRWRIVWQSFEQPLHDSGMKQIRNKFLKLGGCGILPSFCGPRLHFGSHKNVQSCIRISESFVIDVLWDTGTVMHLTQTKVSHVEALFISWKIREDKVCCFLCVGA